MNAIGIIGYHHTGKTTLAVTLIEALVQHGFKVATIKDIHNESYRADAEGSNSWKHAQAGASQVFARGIKDGALILTPAPDLRQMLSLLRADFLIIEGLKEAAVPKIVCADNTSQADELLDDTVFALSGRIADTINSYQDRPVLCLQRQRDELLRLVQKKAFRLLPHSDPECCGACGKSCYQLAGDIVQGRAVRDDCVQDSGPNISLWVGGKQVQIVPFVQNLLRDSVLAFVGNLKDVAPGGDIRVEIKH